MVKKKKYPYEEIAELAEVSVEKVKELGMKNKYRKTSTYAILYVDICADSFYRLVTKIIMFSY